MFSIGTNIFPSGKQAYTTKKKYFWALTAFMDFMNLGGVQNFKPQKQQCDPEKKKLF